METTKNNKSKIQRAWNGRIKTVDSLMAWLYDQDILNKGEKKKKDTLYRAYYRYYNDGDHPRLASNKGLGKYSPAYRIQEVLEEAITDWTVGILNKYKGKYNRQEFYLDQKVKALKTLTDVIGRNDFHGALRYWIPQTPITNPEFNELVEIANEKYANAQKIVYAALPIYNKDIEKSYNRLSDNTGLTYIKDRFKDKNLWTPELENAFNEPANIFLQLYGIVAVELLKAERQLDELKAA